MQFHSKENVSPNFHKSLHPPHNKNSTTDEKEDHSCGFIHLPIEQVEEIGSYLSITDQSHYFMASKYSYLRSIENRLEKKELLLLKRMCLFFKKFLHLNEKQIKEFFIYTNDRELFQNKRSSPEERLLWCVIEDYENLANLLLIGKIDAHAIDTHFILHESCKRGSKELIQKLLARNPDIHLRDKKGKTPLLTAAEFHNYDVINLLLEKGARIYDVDSKNNSVLHLCIFGNFLNSQLPQLPNSFYLKFIQENKNYFYDELIKTEKNYTLGFHKKNTLIISSNKSFNFLSKHIRREYNSNSVFFDLIFLLIEKGALVNIVNDYDQSIYELLVNFLIVENSSEPPKIKEYIYPSAEQTQKIISYLIQIKLEQLKTEMNLDEFSHVFGTALYFGIDHFIEVMAIQIEFDNLQIGDKKFFHNNRKFLFHIAVQTERLNIVELLLRQGANANQKDEQSKTPLQIAVKRKNLALVKLLVEKGKAEIDTKHKKHWNQFTPIEMAKKLPDNEIYRYLLEKLESSAT